MEFPKHTNRLTRETSPYLLQHAHNPVDWYPWNDEAFDQARRQDKPVFLSIGYSSCHWCHVMAHESFENEDIARLMNEAFINVKVDREELPDIDAVYMKAVVEMTGHGGWPMSLFLTPDRIPYLGGTYFPPSPKFNRPGFPQVLQTASDFYKNNRGQLQERAAALLERLETKERTPAGSGVPWSRLIEESVRILSEKYDTEYGGFGMGMKFPEPMHYSLLLRHWLRTGAPEVLAQIDRSLTRMAQGGMCDQIGGGFHRYATERDWRVPHFEKMLYDNALLARLFLHLFQATRQDMYRDVPRDVFQYVLREMTSDEGGFYSSQSADTSGGEGEYYTWTLKEVLDLLGPRHAKVFARAYGMTAGGNFQRRNVLFQAASMEKVSTGEGVAIFEVQHILQQAKSRLFEVREKRQPPGRDEKIITAWNAMMIAALATGYCVLRDAPLLEAALRAGEFVWAHLWLESGLARIWKDGAARFDACLEDYAHLLSACIALYEATFDLKWMERAGQVADRLVDRFEDRERGGFFMTPRTRAVVLTRLKNPADEAVPSANSVAALALLKLSVYRGIGKYRSAAENALRAFQPLIEKSPTAYNGLLAAADFTLTPPTEIVLAGPREPTAFQALVEEVFKDYRPNQVVIYNETPETRTLLPLAEGRESIQGKPTVYVCQKGTCHPPVQTAEALSRLLEPLPEIRINIFDEEKHTADLQTREQQSFLGVMDQIFKHSGLDGK
ncbi:MAG: hypothetical protein COV67_04800 [Nitrospinae bacterium CG11_big_fil_rev_8_21_14_0_20_56_8]|nr:MAG: hypothetical protein COV67_04800 [Nitrospinae bacterium CG11_big_fil_rev_8_21_14_0_20_56_8]